MNRKVMHVRRDRSQAAALRLMGAYLFLLVLVVPAASASWFADVNGGIVYDDNVSNAAYSFDSESDLRAFVGGNGGWTWNPTDNGRLRLRGTLAYNQYDQWDKLSNGLFAIDAAWRQKLRVGNDSPWFDFSVAWNLLAYDSVIRRGSSFGAAVRFGHPVSQRWTYRLGAAYDMRSADSEVFTQDAYRIWFHADIFVPGDVVVFAEYRLRGGEFASSATPPADSGGITAPIVDASNGVLVADDAFPGMIAYRLEGFSHTLRGGMNKAWGDHSMEVYYEYRYAEPDASDVPTYSNNRLGAGYKYRF